MEYILAFGTAFVISFLMTIPAGPLLMLTMQRTLARGVRSAIATATGAATSDALYAVIAASGVMAANNFFDQRHPLLDLLGGTILVVFGLYTVGIVPPIEHPAADDDHGNFMSGFILAIVNPGTLAGFAAVFAVIRNSHSHLLHPLTLILGMIAGSFFCLVITSLFIHRIRHLLSPRTLRILNSIAGLAIMVTGIVFIARGL